MKITENENGQQLVSARELYLGLGLNKSQWSRWYPTNIEKNEFFRKDIDWAGVQHNVEGNEVQDFAISLEFAKHIAMMARTKRSHEYRNYFIECETKLKEIILDSYMISDPVKRAERWIEEEKIRQIQAKHSY
ncbi:antA/AntB antirepressor family protein [Clostridium cadaveris]|uniref:antA/AntB antirepressor family protein n=1 Tax=Clostridium cadaveris TaxID=1529 RepID=UPI0039A20C75